MNLLLKFLNSVDDFSCKSSYFELFILPCIQKNNDSITSNGFIIMNVFFNELLFDNDVIDFDVVFKNFYKTLFFTFFQSFMI